MSGSLWNENGGVYLGYASEATEGPPPPLTKELRYKDDRHILVTGPNGSGKSMRFIYPNVMTLIGWSMLINDVKGEMFDKTAAHRRASGNIVIRLDPFNVCGPGSDSFNPIAALPIDDNLPDDAMELAEALIRISGNDTHWSEAAQELVCGLILYVRLVIPNGSLIDVRRLLGLDFIGWKRLIRGGYNTDPRQYELWEKTPEKDRDPDYEPPFKYDGKLYPGVIEASILHGWPEMDTKLARFGNITPENREMLSVISTALTQTRALDSRSIKKVLSGEGFDYSIAKERPVTVYLILPPRRLATHSGWLRVMIASFLRPLMKDVKPAKVPVMLVLDELYASGLEALFRAL